MAKYYMGIDIGTFESKGTLVDENAKIIAYHACPHEMEVPHPGYAEHDAEKVWWGDLCTISNALIASSGVDPKDIAGVGCSAIGPCCLPVDKDLNPLAIAELIAFCDVRAVMVSEPFADKLDAVDANVRRIGFSELQAWADRGSRQIYYSGDHSAWRKPIDPNSLCLLMPTRDDLGKRTAVMLSHANLCFALSQISKMVSIDAKDRFFSTFPIYRLHGLMLGLL